MADGSNLSYSMAWRETSGALTQNEGNWMHRAEQSCQPSGLTEPLPCGLLLAPISDSLSFYLLCPHALLASWSFVTHGLSPPGLSVFSEHFPK